MTPDANLTPMTERREILVTSALPYANGPIHLGHLLEYIQTDVWARFQRLRGHECHYVCADDAHGTPIMLKAREENVTPETLISRVTTEHLQDFDDFLIHFDNYYTTHSEENREFSNLIYRRLKDKGLISSRNVVQAYDEQAEMFLPDRFIRGDCPRCGAGDQYGDCCEACGATYTPGELKNARSVLSGAKPVERESEHYFFELARFSNSLGEWLESAGIQPAIRNKLGEWFDAGLRDWDISRDAPYFGFEIPDHPGKYFYVWLDAPIGYMASFKQYCEREALDFDRYWQVQSPTELHHFIGKDIAYFHALFWPAMLEGADFRKPTALHCHGFLTVDKKKMSKSRGTFITARTYLRHLDPEYLRYYFAAKLGGGVEDLNLNLDDFVQRVNSDLIGKIVNIASRCAGFIHRHFESELLCSDEVNKHPLNLEAAAAGERIAEFYETLEYAFAVREISALADRANQYIDRHKPWETVKQDGASRALHEVCSLGLLLFARIMLYLKPVLPVTSAKAEDFLGVKITRWNELPFTQGRHRINRFKPLMTRIEKNAVNKVIADTAQDARAATAAGETAGGGKEVTIEEFQKLDLRVARVVKAENVEEADKLLRLEVDLGDETRTVLAGIKSSYEAADLVGRLVVIVANLKPRKMRFGISQGMVLAAGEDQIFLLSPDEGAEAGMKVK